MYECENTSIENGEIFDNNLSGCFHELLAEKMCSPIVELSLKWKKTWLIIPDRLIH
jgi:hypothetical protein